MQVSLQALKAFEAAARLGSFKLAAEELSLTPTAISHHIGNLESRLNVNLFHRETRKIVLTRAGKQLARGTSDGFRRIENALAELRTADSLIRVATTSSLAAMILIPSMQEFSQSNPNISVEISTGEAVDNHAYTLPVRFGNSTTVEPSSILKHESFDIFGAREVNPESWSTTPISLFTTEWKNEELPEPPLAAWLQANKLSEENFIIKKFDQELFGIQQAMTENGLVFCSTTLTQRLVKANLLQQFGTQSVQSELCYYVPDKEHYDHRHIVTFLNWLEVLLSNN